MVGGAFTSAAGTSLLALAMAEHQLAIFLLATATAGASYSLLFLGLGGDEQRSAASQRGGVLFALSLLGYLSMGAVALVLGAVATARGLGLAIDLGVGEIALLSLTTVALTVSMRDS